MKQHNALISRATVWIALAAALSATSPAPSVAAPRDKEPFAYIANNESPNTVLESIAETFGLTISAAPISGPALSGKIAGASLAQVLNELARTYNFDWFIHGGTIYVFKARDWTTERINVGPVTEELRDSLSSYGLVNPKFKILEQPERESIIVTGPVAYVNLVKNALQIAPGSSDFDIMVYKLKYASVDDRVITLRDKSVTTPGIANILRSIIVTPQSNMASLSTQTLSVNGMPVALPGMPPQADALSALAAQNAADAASRKDGRSFERDGNAMGGADRSLNQTGGVKRPGVIASVQADPRTNTLIIRDKSSKFAQYRSLLDQLDVPLAMVEIEAIMIDIDQRKLDELGLEFGVSIGKTSFDFNGLPQGTTSNGATANPTAVVADRARFTARIQALVATNDASVLAKPTILTLDNLSAVIDLTQTFYTKVSGERVANVVPVTAGSLLRVAPRIVTAGANRQISLQVDIEDGSLQDRVGVDLPTVQKSAISTQATISENQAILIGGYNRESSQQFGAKIPGWSDLPVIGKLLQTSSNTKQRVTRLFMITPRIIKQPVMQVPVAAAIPPSASGAARPL